MALVVWTARISTRDPDALNVTRKSGSAIFAPSWRIVAPALERRQAGREATDEEWKEYAQAYFLEMQASRRKNVEVWKALLARERVVLTCYCTNPARCHRTLLGRFLTKLGATFEGELAEQAKRDRTQEELFKIAMDLGDPSTDPKVP